MSISKARSIAFNVLRRVAMNDAYADESLRAALIESVSAPDAGLATEVTLGVLRWQRLLDFFIDRDLDRKIKLLDVEVRIALRMGIYQLRFLDRVPAHAVVNESVELVKAARKRSAVPLVNALLRKTAKEAPSSPSLPESVSSLLSKDLRRAEFLGIQYSHPTWLVDRWLTVFGEERTLALLAANNRLPPLAVYILGPARRAAAMASLQQAGCEVKPGQFLQSAWTLHGGNPAASEAVRNGWAAIQDEASQAVAHLVSVTPGNTVLDLCAAPGGKTILLSMAAGPQGHVTAADIHHRRVRAMAQRFEHAGAKNVETLVLDGSKLLPFSRLFDRILVDVPCSGTGTLARHPEIRWRIHAEDISNLQTRQIALLANALPALAPGGRLVYSTCSLEPEENEIVVREVLKRFDNKFQLVRGWHAIQQILRDSQHAEDVMSPDGLFRTFPPTHGTDGFFAAIIERASE